MADFEYHLTDPKDIDVMFDSVGIGSFWEQQMRPIPCPDHGQTPGYSMGLSNELGTQSASILTCCEKFAKYLLACCRYNRDGGTKPDWYEGRKIDLVAKGPSDEHGMKEFRFTDPRVLVPFMQSLGEVWDQEVATMKCSSHGLSPAGRDHKQIFTAVTQNEPNWGSIRVCCEAFAKECLIKLVNTVQKDRDDSVFDSDLID